MLVVLFRSKLVDAPDGYAEMAQELLELAKTMPGFVKRTRDFARPTA